MRTRSLVILLLVVFALAYTSYAARRPGDGPLKRLIGAVHGTPGHRNQ